MSYGDDQQLGDAEWPPRSLFDEPTIQVSLSQENQPVGVAPRGRILGDDSPGPLGQVPGSITLSETPPPNWLDDRPAPPFASPGALTAAGGTTMMERIMEGAYRWRSLLGLGLAGVMTLAIVVAYNGASSEDRTEDALVGSQGRTGQAMEVDDTADAPAASSPSPSSQVSSEVDEVTTTLAPAGPVQSRTPTTSGGNATTASTVGSSTSVPDASTTVTVDPSSTSSPSASTTEPPASTSSSAASTTAPSASTTLPSSTTTTAPTSSTVPHPKLRLEAENGALVGSAQVRSDDPGFSGTGFVGELVAQGRGVTVTITDATGGLTPLRIRYSAGNDSLPGATRQLSMRVNGTTVARLDMRVTASWSDWTDLPGDVELTPGQNTITLIVGRGDSGFVNVDFVELY